VVGKVCTVSGGGPGGECGDPAQTGAICLLTKTLSPTDSRGVCTCQCTPDDLQTPLVNEDSCPDLSQNLCGSVTLTDGSKIGFCFRRCKPKLGANDCAQGVACDPRSGEVIEQRDTAVCLLHGCQSNADCPVRTATPCKVDGSVTCPAGMGCYPLQADGVEGRCAKAGVCEKSSGLCAPRLSDFAPNAQVGDPCAADLDCGKTMRCELEEDRPSLLRKAGQTCVLDRECCGGSCVGNTCAPGPCAVHARNGYCTVVGCAFSSLLAYQCPAGSACNRYFYGGLCQKNCSLNNAKSCRGVAADKRGDYECRAWERIAIGGLPVAPAPLCDFGDTAACTLIKGAGCAALGSGPANPTKMSCRDAQSGAALPAGDPTGLCLDDTASGS
jgi:hypothetical protein